MEQPVTIHFGPQQQHYLSGILRTSLVHPQRLVVICHGVLGHKEYLFQPQLAKELDFFGSTFRFDFRGNGDSSGETKYGRYAEDVEDLAAVVAHFRAKGYRVEGLIGHSRGGLSSLKYAAQDDTLGFVVNLSGRFTMADGPKKHTAEEMAHLKEHGFFYWSFKVKGEPRKIKVTQADIDEFASYDTTFLSALRPSLPVLTCFGLEDEVVPVADSANYANVLTNHTLKLIPGANHFYKGKFAEVIKEVVDWIRVTETGRYAKLLKLVEVRRVIPLAGVTNFRDVGGYPTSNGMVVRSRAVFRSGELQNLEAIEDFLVLGVCRGFDLRSDLEGDKRGYVTFPNEDGTGFQVSRTPVFKDEDYSPLSLAQRWGCYAKGPAGFSDAYLQILEKGGPAFKAIFDYVAVSKLPVVIFCTAGKDRTGVFTMLLLGLLGVEDDLICSDYSLTERVDPVTEEVIERVLMFSENHISREGATNMMSSKPEAMQSTLTRLRERWGGISQYLDSIGVTLETQNKIKKRLLVPATSQL